MYDPIERMQARQFRRAWEQQHDGTAPILTPTERRMPPVDWEAIGRQLDRDCDEALVNLLAIMPEDEVS
ncbi:MAG: hypothetical protein JWQ02_1037 [Capsulimonas sp.]|nr:hypothetical protein [Capsulimonas sp.]